MAWVPRRKQEENNHKLTNTWTVATENTTSDSKNMERDLTLKEKIQIYMKNRKEITLFNLLILSLILCFTYMFLDIIF